MFTHLNLPFNEIILRKNKCLFEKYKLNNGLKNFWTIYNIGLSNKKTLCKIFSISGNFGNGVISCDENEPNNYKFQAIVKVGLLDEILADHKNIKSGC